jgi:hypothetical protein
MMIGLQGLRGAGRGCQLIDGNLGEAGAHNHGPGLRSSNWKKLTLDSQQRLEETRP